MTLIMCLWNALKRCCWTGGNCSRYKTNQLQVPRASFSLESSYLHPANNTPFPMNLGERHQTHIIRVTFPIFKCQTNLPKHKHTRVPHSVHLQYQVQTLGEKIALLDRTLHLQSILQRVSFSV